ncbi:hypothetical protein ILYODFUR_001773 [Ilyodon furcidens]|uniref:Uncharacterized protein n=1 Tax=Ilyodon furcidens TaxID=33524 RepID=A0ABV0STF8_9TELE
MIVSIKKSERGKEREERSLGHRFHSVLSYLPCSTLRTIHKLSLPHSRKEVHLGIGCRKNWKDPPALKSVTSVNFHKQTVANLHTLLQRFKSTYRNFSGYEMFQCVFVA